MTESTGEDFSGVVIREQISLVTQQGQRLVLTIVGDVCVVLSNAVRVIHRITEAACKRK